MRMLRFVFVTFLLVFVLPAAVSAGLWLVGDHPRSWRAADWTSAHLLPPASELREPALYILAARTGGLKGAVSEHSWIVMKDAGRQSYERFDKAGWGEPIKTNNWAPDARWYSNEPYVVAEFHGEAAETLIPRVKAAIAAYPYSHRGDYQIFPGPNSNSFVAYVMREVRGLGAFLPPAAVGRDYPVDGSLFALDTERGEFRLSLWGYAGLAVGRDVGFEINILGLVAGFDPFDLKLKVPAFGTVG
ncbi:MAG: DUF3750 domain-containing protein [Fulvimarina manganoxydans]|nr:DUF3750 domain-containing protein [Fulvimarina manganoxydans]MCK5933583.1 DUF3750 domain-containing protein [Fulvimarina manganoxydans]